VTSGSSSGVTSGSSSGVTSGSSSGVTSGSSSGGSVADGGGDSGPGNASSSGGAGGSSSGVATGSSSGGAGAGSSGGSTDNDASATPVLYGQPYTDGVYNLGPVDYAETDYHNACAPTTKYDPRIQAVEGTLLAGLWDGIPNVSSYCDACIYVTTSKGKSALLRVVTYGVTTNDSIDTSQDAFNALTEGEYPRNMTWQFAECPDTGPMIYEFQTEASQWWTSLWVRNARVPLAKVEVESPNHPTWFELTRGSDGTLTDASGFGQGSFSIRSTGIDGTQIVESFTWPSAGIAGAFLTGTQNFP
jgi:expansin (peptidoglycan-binding protein)